MRRLLLPLFVVLAFLVESSFADPTIKLGEKAPKLSIEEFLKGEKIEKFEDGKVYVLDFWATWCPPCIKSIPHLSELQKKFKDKVVIIGIANSERSRKEKEAD